MNLRAQSFPLERSDSDVDEDTPCDDLLGVAPTLPTPAVRVSIPKLASAFDRTVSNWIMVAVTVTTNLRTVSPSSTSPASTRTRRQRRTVASVLLVVLALPCFEDFLPVARAWTTAPAPLPLPSMSASIFHKPQQQALLVSFGTEGGRGHQQQNSNRNSFHSRTSGRRSNTARYAALGPAAAATAAATTMTTTATTTTTAVAGKVWPLLRRITGWLHPSELLRVAKGVQAHLHPQDWIFLAVLGVVGYCHLETTKGNRRKRRQSIGSNSDDDNDDDAPSRLLVSSILRRVYVIRAVQELAQVAFVAYVVDILCLILRLQHVHFPHLWDVPRVFAKSSFSVWALRQFLRRKRDFLKNRLGSGFGGASAATVDLVNKFVNVISVALMALLISDWVSVELGLALKGVVTLGSLGTLAFTLASKDLASQIVSGLFLQAGNKMRSGEKVALGSSTGKVVKIGLTETVLRASDNTITSIPNAKVSQDKVINYSRVPVSQVDQKLRFHVEDIDVLPDVLESIRNEIKKSCPKLIVDGSRPFRVFFTDYAENSLEVMIDTHFAISPTSDEYWVNRQEVLMAINRAVKSHRIQYAYSTTTPQEVVGRQPPPTSREGEVLEGRPGPDRRWDDSTAPTLNGADNPSFFPNNTVVAPRGNN